MNKTHLGIIILNVAVLILTSIITNLAQAQGQVALVFYLTNKHLGDNIVISVTGEGGQAMEWRMNVTDSSNIDREPPNGYFHRGEQVTACITNFSRNGYENCTRSIISTSDVANFFLTASPS